MAPKASGSGSKKRKADDSDAPMTLPVMLSYLQSTRGMSLAEAMRASAPLLKAGLSSPALIAELDADDLNDLGLGAGEDGERIVKKLTSKAKRTRKKKDAPTNIEEVVQQSAKRSTGDKNWYRDRDLDKPLPDMDGERKPARPDVAQGDLDFDEELDEFVLRGKKVLANRAPILLAWATVVCEALGFSREEALSVGQAVTSMNAVAKGVAQGIMPKEVEERSRTGSSQPYVQLLGRQVPVLSLQNGQWRGLAEGQIADPTEAYGYIHRSLRQQMGALVGSMRLLASAFDPDDLNKRAYELYLSLRPGGQATLKWGEKEEVRMADILDLRPEPKPEPEDVKPIVDTVEDFDALLDDDLDDALLVKTESA